MSLYLLKHDVISRLMASAEACDFHLEHTMTVHFCYYLKSLVVIYSDHGEELGQPLEETNWR